MDFKVGDVVNYEYRRPRGVDGRKFRKCIIKSIRVDGLEIAWVETPNIIAGSCMPSYLSMITPRVVKSMGVGYLLSNDGVAAMDKDMKVLRNSSRIRKYFKEGKVIITGGYPRRMLDGTFMDSILFDIDMFITHYDNNGDTFNRNYVRKQIVRILHNGGYYSDHGGRYFIKSAQYGGHDNSTSRYKKFQVVTSTRPTGDVTSTFDFTCCRLKFNPLTNMVYGDFQDMKHAQSKILQYTGSDISSTYAHKTRNRLKKMVSSGYSLSTDKTTTDHVKSIVVSWIKDNMYYNRHRPSFRNVPHGV